MLISRIEIAGFKSFPEKTVLEFNGGITGVVGPNGCGKSNILDSIRWVLGEQRTSVLRSSKMEEIIFSGTNTLKATGMAEVNLTIHNNRGVLPIEYDDVVITRRLFRSGESEYLLNKNRCRLKDIMELFYDTGMGPHAYSVIQQGMIESILSDKTEDRRSLFEEAAGVTKYKHRKKEAENKLQATDADLLRLGDVIAEIENQVTQLRRQAKRARRYSARKEELKNIEISLAAALLYESHQKYEQYINDRRNLYAEIESAVADMDKFTAEIQTNKLELTRLENEASNLRQREADISLKAAEIESEIKLNQQKSDSSNEEIDNRKTEITRLNDRISRFNEEIDRKRTALHEAGEKRKISTQESELLENDLGEYLERLHESEKKLESARKENSEFSDRLSGLRAEISSVSEMKSSLSRKMEQTEKSAEDYHIYTHENRDDIKNLEMRRDELHSRIESSKTGQQSRNEKIADLEKSISILRDDLSVRKARQSGLEARRELLKQLIETGEGYSGGARAILSWDSKPQGILVPISEVIGVPEQYRVAVNAALGDMGELIPVRSYEDARAGIEYIKTQNSGRASFIILQNLGDNDKSPARPALADGCIGYLDDLVSCPQEYGPVVRLLLNRVALFKSEEDALNADGGWEAYTRVTLDGLALMPSALISGGQGGGSILGRRQDLQELDAKSERLGVETAEMESDLLEKQKSLDTLKADFQENNNIIRQLEIDREKIKAELAQLNFDFRQKESEYSAAMNEAGRLQEDINNYEKKLEYLNRDLETFANKLTGSSTVLESIVSEVDGFRLKIKDIEGKLTKARIQNVELDGQCTKIESEIQHASELLDEAGKMIETHRENIARLEELIGTMARTNDNLKSDVEKCFSGRNEIKEELLKAEGEISEKDTKVAELENNLGSHRKLKEAKQSRLHDLDLEIKEIESSRNSITERVKLEFGVMSIESAQLKEDQSAELLREEAEKIRSELQRMEPVNLMAAEDYERENDRLNFLNRQREDLLDAKASLKQAIIKINDTAEERFNNTFSKIEGNYQEVFGTLFENGEAHITLEDPSDPLESPIKIMARPGGKKMLSVAQLSGGERALTAISLLFAIYLVKPSPFCILDEVDAPLDDINLARFLKLIKKFSENTQFIIITHNKLTMEASDILYGVTMEQPGVSKVVSVKFGGGNGDGDIG